MALMRENAIDRHLHKREQSLHPNLNRDNFSTNVKFLLTKSKSQFILIFGYNLKTP
jgi:hypothetical protein